jgi:hypothetical protein
MRQRLPRPTSPKQQGFALLITIILVAFLVLLLVGLATFTRVETSVAGNSSQLQLARQNALAGLNVAIGNLQQHAGPDQRVTAKADILAGTNPSKQNWTGVWNSTNAAGPLAWLVSGSAPNNIGPAPTLPAGVNADDVNVRLVGTNSAGLITNSEIVVPLENLTADSLPGGLPDGTRIGQYGWWVADEGVKAKINLVDPFTPANDDPFLGGNYTPSTAESINRLLVAQRLGVENINADFADYIVSPDPQNSNSDKLRRDTFKLLVLNSLPLLDIGGVQIADPAVTAAAFHDITLQSRSVLSDTRNGGLQQDLSWEFNPLNSATATLSGAIPTSVVIPNGPTWEQLRDFAKYSYPPFVLNAPVSPQAHTATNYGIAPILIQVRYYYSGRIAGVSPAPYQLGLKLRPWIVIANPYDVPIAASSYIVTQTFTGGTITIDSTDVDLGTAWNIKFRLNAPQLAPGKAYIFTLAVDDSAWAAGNIYEMDNDFAKDHGIIYPLTGSPTTLATFADLRLSASGAVSTTLAIDSGPVIHSVNGGGLGGTREIDLENYQLGTNSISGVGPWHSAGGHSFKLVDLGTFSYSLDIDGETVFNTYRQFNWRSPYLSRLGNELFFNDPVSWTTNVDYTDKLFNETDPQFSSGTQEIKWGAASSRPGGSSSNTLEADTYLPLSLPQGYPITSIAQLAHFNVAAAPTVNSQTGLALNGLYSVGAGWANPFIPRIAVSRNFTTGVVGQVFDVSYLLNEALFDTFYFSALPAAGVFDISAPRSVVNTRLKPFAELDVTGASYVVSASSPAATLLLDGGFNINSTSVPAWRALLASFRDASFQGVTSPTSPAFRVFNPINGSVAPDVSVANQSTWSGWVDIPDATLDVLATNIVTQVKARGPFRSLGDFVNRRLAPDPTGLSGALQAAIDATPGMRPVTIDETLNPYGDLRTTTPFDSIDYADNAHKPSSVFEGLPGWVNQIDLLRGLAPVLRPRSDTFKVRAYGAVLNPATGATEGQAWCEAIVQRLPTYVDEITDPLPSATPAPGGTNDRFGRKFVITQFRWLGPNDI